MAKITNLMRAFILCTALTGSAHAEETTRPKATSPEWVEELLQDSVDGAGCAHFAIALRRCAMLAPSRRRMLLCVLETSASEGAACAGSLQEQLQELDLPLPAGF